MMGTAIGKDHLQDGEYKNLAIQQYNLVTAENACKWSGTEPQQGKFDFSDCDFIANFTAQEMKGTFRVSFSPGTLKHSLPPCDK